MAVIPGPAVAVSATGQQLAIGPQGLRGPQGIQGPQGQAGTPGQAVPVPSILVTTSTTLTAPATNQVYLVQSAAAITVTITGTPVDGVELTFIDDTRNWPTYAFGFVAQAGASVRDPQNLGTTDGSSVSITQLAGGAVTLKWNAGVSDWLVESTAGNYGPANLAYVTGALAVASIAPGTNGQVLTTTTGVSTWATPALTGINQLTGDVTAGVGTGSQAATVVSAQGGTFAFGSATGTITTSYAATATGLTQTSTGIATAHNMVLAPQASTNTNGTPGSLVISLAQPTGTGSEAYALVQRNGYPLTHVGYYAGYGGFWLHSGTGPEVPGVGNYTLLSNSSSLYINANSSAGSIYLGTNGALYAGYSSSGMQLGAASLSAGGGVGGVLGLTNGSTAVTQASVPTTGSVIHSYGGNLNLYAANAVAGNNAPGSVIVNVGSPTGTGDSGSFSVINANYSATVPVFEARPLYGTPSYAAVYLGVVPNSSNASFYGTSSFTYMSNSTTIGLLLASAYFALYASASTNETVVGSNYNFALAGASATTGEYGGGQRVLSIGKAVTNPTTALTTSSVIYSDHTSGAISLYPLGVTTPTLSIGSLGSGVGVMKLADTATPPSVIPTGGCYVWSASSALSVMDSNGSVASLTGRFLTFLGSTSTSGIQFPVAAGSAGNFYITGQQTSSGGGGNINIVAGTGTTTGGIALLAGGAGTTTGGILSLATGSGSTNGALTISSGTGTVYNTATGIYSSGNTPGAWTWYGPSVTNTQLTAGTGKTALNTGAIYTFLPVIINGKAMQVVCCF